MPHNRILYQVENIFVGPSPSTGYNFVNTSDVLNDNSHILGGNFNLIQQLFRVQSASYSINSNISELREIGKHGAMARPMSNPASVDLEFTYLQMGVANEQRQGLYVNFTTEMGTPFYSNNTGVFLLSGLVDRNFTNTRAGSSGYSGYSGPSLVWPITMRDNRNIFIAQEAEGRDLNRNFTSPAHPNSRNLGVLGFGNCYLNSYKTSARVGGFPEVSVNYVCENINFSSSGSGFIAPSIFLKSGTPLGKSCVVPLDFEGSGVPSVLTPGDITFSMSSLQAQTNIIALYGTGVGGGINSTFSDQGFSLSDIKLQSYSIDLNLDREPLLALDYKYPLDRVINFPVTAQIGLEFIVGDLGTGSLIQLTKQNMDYNLSIKLRELPKYGGDIAVQYDFIRAKFSNITYTSSIGPSKIGVANYVADLDPNDFSRGMFISGQINATGHFF